MKVTNISLSSAKFAEISRMLCGLTGIEMRRGKEELVKARLFKRLRLLRIGSFEEYLEYINSDASGQELLAMVEALTTNKTSFFREAKHFDFFAREILPALEGRRIRLWSAGCSSGEEPFTLAILMSEGLMEEDRMNARILATDINTRVLSRAREGVYGAEELREMPARILRKYFVPVLQAASPAYRLNDETKSMVSFARLNLVDDWPMKGPFQAIFCRNVMIYMDKGNQERLIRRFWELLEPGGYLFVGHSESLALTSCDFRYVQPAIYVR